MSNEEDNQEPNKENLEKDYQILKDDYPNYDLTFKVIVIGNSSK